MTSIKISDSSCLGFMTTEEDDYEIGFGFGDSITLPIDLESDGKIIEQFQAVKKLEYNDGVFKSSIVSSPSIYHYPSTPNIKIGEKVLLIFDSTERAYRVAKELDKHLLSLLKNISIINCDEDELAKAIKKNGDSETIADSVIYNGLYCGHTFYCHLHSKYPFDCKKECILSLSKKIKTKFKEALEKIQ